MFFAYQFPHGKFFATPGVLEQVSERDRNNGLFRHLQGDWGDLCEEDKRRNEQALHCGDRLFSAYRSCEGVKFWIITEADRSATTILLPEEY